MSNKAAEMEIVADFCVIVSDDSMEMSRILKGDRVYISETDSVNDGDIIAAVIDNSLHLKRIYRDIEHSGLILKADNPKYSPLVLSENEAANINILGKAVAFSSSTI